MKHLRKIIYGITTAALLVATFTTSTYAWLNFSAKAEVSGFSFTATSGMGFKISIDNKNWTSHLNLADIEKSALMSYDSSIYKLDEDGQTFYKLNNSNQWVEMSDTDINKDVAEKIQLLPVTTTNGRDFKDLYGGRSSTASGNFLEFFAYATSVPSASGSRKDRADS